jgi:hypothetical protein
MLPWLTLLMLVAAAAKVFCTPKPQRRAYRASFVARHGLGVQVGLTVLATLTLAMVFATLLDPGTHPLMEFVDSAVVLLGLACGAADLHLFARKPRRE